MSARRFPLSLFPSSRKQWLGLCVIAAILLAHLALIDWAKDSLALIQLLDDEDETVIVELNTGKPPSSARPRSSAPPARRTAPVVPAPSETASVSPPVAPPASESPANQDTAALTPASPASSAEPVSAAQAESATALPSPGADKGADSAAPSGTALSLFSRVSFPPSAELSYDALAVQGSRQLSGSGSIVWQQNGLSYSIKGEASALLLTLLSYQSSGQLSSAGILPELYHEKRIGKSATSTHFVRERKTISFSASTATHEIEGGEQDRGSVIWQLAGLTRGDPDKLTPGLAFDAVIAGSKAAERWSVQVIGKETVPLGGAQLSGWHLALAPAENNFDYKIDLWLSPDRDWYPVKIMYTNRNGATLTLSLAKLVRK